MIPLKLLKEKTKDFKWWTLGDEATEFSKKFEDKYAPAKDDSEEAKAIYSQKKEILEDQGKFSEACKELELNNLHDKANNEEALAILDKAIKHANNQRTATFIGFEKANKLETAINIIKQFATAFELKLDAFPAPAPEPDDKPSSKIDTPSLMTPPKIPAAVFQADSQEQIDNRLGKSKYKIQPNNPTASDLSSGSKVYKISNGTQKEVVNMTPNKISLTGKDYQELAQIAVVLLKQSGIPDGKQLPVTGTPKALLKAIMTALTEAGYKPVEKPAEKKETSEEKPTPKGFGH